MSCHGTPEVEQAFGLPVEHCGAGGSACLSTDDIASFGGLMLGGRMTAVVFLAYPPPERACHEISAPIDSRRRRDSELRSFIRSDRGIDTPLGAREFQTFLVAKQREIAAIVGRAHELDRAKAAVLESLRAQYAGSAG